MGVNKTQPPRPRRKVRFSKVDSSSRQITEEFATWRDNETADVPTDFEITHAEQLAKEALAEAAAEEQRDAKNSSHHRSLAELVSSGLKKAKSKLAKTAKRLDN